MIREVELILNRKRLQEVSEEELKRFKLLLEEGEETYILDIMLEKMGEYEEEISKLYGSVIEISKNDLLRSSLFYIVERSLYTTLTEAAIVYNFRYAGYLPKEFNFIFDLLFIDNAAPLKIENDLGINKHTVYKKKREINRIFIEYVKNLTIEELNSII